jgi:hypothetical protein
VYTYRAVAVAVAWHTVCLRVTVLEAMWRFVSIKPFASAGLHCAVVCCAYVPVCCVHVQQGLTVTMTMMMMTA